MNTRPRPLGRVMALASLTLAGVVVACSDDGPGGPLGPDEVTCGALDPFFLSDGGVGRDGIPALTDPAFVPATDQSLSAYIPDQARVIGVHVGGEWLVIPHNLMYRHEIVNLNRGDDQIAISYCPLTGSALGFDRSSVDGAEFGVSGLLYQANLIMYDRTAPNESFWPQMAGEAACGPREGQALTRFPVVETTWGGWKELHPQATVVSVPATDADTYRVNPYGAGYEAISNGDFLGFPINITDARRQPKERVLGLPSDGVNPPLAFPFLAMASQGDQWIGEFTYDGADAVVFWDLDRMAAVALRPMADGQALTFRIEDGSIFDNETGTRWSVTGTAIAGPLVTERLDVIPESYVAFWQAWSAFHSGTELAIE